MIVRITKSPNELAWVYTMRYTAYIILPTVIILGVVLYGFVFRSYALPDELPYLLRSIFPGAVGATLGAGFVMRIAYRNLFDLEYHKPAPVDRTERLSVNLPYHQAFDRCLAALPGIGACHLLYADRERGMIEIVRVPTPFWKALFSGYGERISIRLGSDREGVTVAQVTSRAPLSTMIFGAGQHLRNLRNLKNLSNFLQSSAA